MSGAGGSDTPVPLTRRLLQYLGLANAPGGEPRTRRGPSRYSVGQSVSVRLDEDVDELRQRVERLEARLGER